MVQVCGVLEVQSPDVINRATVIPGVRRGAVWSQVEGCCKRLFAAAHIVGTVCFGVYGYDYYCNSRRLKCEGHCF